MTSATLPSPGIESLPDEEAPIEAMRRWFLPTPGSVDHGLFERALRAAASAWQPNWFGAARSKLEAGPIMALPEILEAWRATERELAGIADDSPDQELLEANARMLRAMYQRLYRERTGR
jgi:hypothetical protein